MLDRDQILREALRLGQDERRHLARELLASIDPSAEQHSPPRRHPLIPDEGLVVRYSTLAFIVIKLRIGGEDCLLLNYRRPWSEWIFPAGGVEDRAPDLPAAAVAEAVQALAPLQQGNDFEVGEPVAQRDFGAALSPTHFGVAIVRRTVFYLLKLKSPPAECLGRLPKDAFRFTRLSELANDDIGRMVATLQSELQDGWSSVPPSWGEALELDPLRHGS